MVETRCGNEEIYNGLTNAENLQPTVMTYWFTINKLRNLENWIWENSWKTVFTQYSE